MADIYKVPEPYEGKVRIRTCGILVHQKSILLIKHKGLGTEGEMWLPPGGGIEFGETIFDGIKREFKEETNLEVSPNSLLFTHEFISQKLHAIEFFISVQRVAGELKLGSDPEHTTQNQIMTEIKFFDDQELKETPKSKLHNVFSHFSTSTALLCNKNHVIQHLKNQ